MTPAQIDELLVKPMALALESHARETYRGTDVMTMLPPDWEPWIGSARAAIARMRAMLDANGLSIVPKGESPRCAPREVLNEAVAESGLAEWGDDIDRAVDSILAKLESTGLFIVPEVATEEMEGAMVDVFGENGTAGEMWAAGVSEWRRGGGA